jgi:hypothetical protein
MIDHSLLRPTMTDEEVFQGLKISMEYEVAATGKYSSQRLSNFDTNRFSLSETVAPPTEQENTRNLLRPRVPGH